MVTEYEFNIRKDIVLAELEDAINETIGDLGIDSSLLGKLDTIKELYLDFVTVKEQTYRDAIMDDQFNRRKD